MITSPKATSLIREKLEQATRLVKESGVGVWLTFVRETAEGSDPVLPFLIEGGLTWQSALLVTESGRRIAIVGNYDADPLVSSGHWDEVVPYVQSIREPLLDVLERVCPQEANIALNYSTSDVKADGLSHGMYLLLSDYFRGTRFESSLVSAEEIVMSLRGVKTSSELRAIQSAIAAGDDVFRSIEAFARVGITERAVFDHVHRIMSERGLGFSWDPAGDPIVNSGPDSMIGHGIPSDSITIQPGHIFHIDLGVIKEGYSSDVQRCWYVPGNQGESVPDDVRQGLDAVNRAISAGAGALRPGVEGWQVDSAARTSIAQSGYDEYMHALGHQVGRVAHDGGAILGPRWERYGRTPMLPIKEGEVYTLELGVTLPGRGYLGIEEMVVVTNDGCRFLTERQLSMPLLPP